MVHGLWFKAHGSCLKARDSRPRKIGAGSPRPQALAPIFGPGAASLEAWALSHKPWTIKNRLIDEVFHYIWKVLDIPKKSKLRLLKTFLGFLISSVFVPEFTHFPNLEIQTFKVSKFQDFKSSKFGCTHVLKHYILLILIFPKIIFSKMSPIYFLICFEVFCCNTGHKYGVHGSRFGH